MRVVGKPAELDLDDDKRDGRGRGARVREEARRCGRKVGAAGGSGEADRLAWIAYPKAGQLGTDLNRDILWQHLLPRGITGVRQISIDDVWSAMRFRPSK